MNFEKRRETKNLEDFHLVSHIRGILLTVPYTWRYDIPTRGDAGKLWNGLDL